MSCLRWAAHTSAQMTRSNQQNQLLTLCSQHQMPLYNSLIQTTDIIQQKSKVMLMSSSAAAGFSSKEGHNHSPCDGGLISSNGIVGPSCSHVAYVPALQVCEGLGIHCVVAGCFPFAAGVHLGTNLHNAEGCGCAACCLHTGRKGSERGGEGVRKGWGRGQKGSGKGAASMKTSDSICV